eukprot:233720_1
MHVIMSIDKMMKGYISNYHTNPSILMSHCIKPMCSVYPVPPILPITKSLHHTSNPRKLQCVIAMTSLLHLMQIKGFHHGRNHNNHLGTRTWTLHETCGDYEWRTFSELGETVTSLATVFINKLKK